MKILTEPMTAAERAANKAERKAWDDMEKRIAELEEALDDILMHAVYSTEQEWVMISKVEFDQAVERLKRK